MRIAYTSDLHLEFADCELVGTGDVLVLAGDIMLASDVEKHPWVTLEDQVLNTASYLRSSRYKAFFARVHAQFAKVLYICGNHEFYYSDIGLARNVLRDNLSMFPNVQLLDNEIVEIGDIKFVASTLWSDLSNPVEARTVSYGLNDYKVIRKNGTNKAITTTDIQDLYETSKAFIQNTQNVHVVITHHAPSFKSIGGNYTCSELSAAYASNLGDLVLDLNPELWVHGHCHDPAEYSIGETLVSSNPRGYSNQKTNVNLKIYTINHTSSDLS